MILIADSGSTKTDWALVNPAGNGDNALVATFHTQGITPIHQTPLEISQIVGQELMSQLSAFPRAKLIPFGILETPLLSNLKVYFYGSGCTPAYVPKMKQMLSGVLSSQVVEVHSDLMGAARGLCGREEGIACILGTGANSCLYDGEQIVQNTPAMGYILGDEGSGSVLGRRFLNAIFKNPALEGVRDDYLKVNKLNLADIIRKTYREPMANRFLASLSLYIGEHLDNPLLEELVIDNFRQFFRSNLIPYGRKDLPVHFIGSMAFNYQCQLQQAAQDEGFVIGKVLQSPLQGLIDYHLGA